MTIDAYEMWDASYVLGALSSSERREYETHLAECVRCRSAVADLSGVPALLALVDDIEGDVTCPQNTLAVDETITCTLKGVAVEGLYTNSGTFKYTVGNTPFTLPTNNVTTRYNPNGPLLALTASAPARNSSRLNHRLSAISSPSGVVGWAWVCAVNAIISELGNGHGCVARYWTPVTGTTTPASSPTSRTTACSNVSPGSTKPANVEYQPSGQIPLRPSSARSWSSITSVLSWT